jgi:hypothetical protein
MSSFLSLTIHKARYKERATPFEEPSWRPQRWLLIQEDHLSGYGLKFVLAMVFGVLCAGVLPNAFEAQAQSGVTLDVSLFGGSDFGAKVQACLNALPSTGGSCDAQSLSGPQTAAATISVPDHAWLILPTTATSPAGTGAIVVAASTAATLGVDSHIVGQGKDATILSCSVAGCTVVAAKDQTVIRAYASVDHVQLVPTGANGIGVNYSALSNFRFEENFINLPTGGGSIGITCNTISAGKDSTYGFFLHNRIQLNTATDAGIVLRGICNAGRYIENRTGGNANNNAAVVIGGPLGGPADSTTNFPNQLFFDGTTMENTGPTGTGFQIWGAVVLIVKGGRCEGLGTCVRLPDSGSAFGISIETPYLSTNMTTGLQDGSPGAVGWDFVNRSQNVTPYTSGWGIADYAAPNMLPNSILEGWQTTSIPDAWTGINFSAGAWNLNATGVLNRQASSGLTYPAGTSGSYAAKVGDGTTSASQGIIGGCMGIDATKQLSATGLLGLGATGTKLRFGARFFSDSSCATPITTTSTNALFVDLNDAANGHVSIGTLTYNRTIGGNANCPIHLNGADVPSSSISTNTMTRFSLFFRAPSNAQSMRIAFVVNTAGTNNNFYVDEFYVAHGWANSVPYPAMLGDTGNGGYVIVNGGIQMPGVVQGNLGTPANGTVIYCSDCTIANPCAAGGNGALAKRLNGVWVCN